MKTLAFTDEQLQQIKYALEEQARRDRVHPRLDILTPIDQALAEQRPRAMRIILYYLLETLAPGQLPAESSLEVTYKTKEEAAAVFEKMIAYNKEDLFAKPAKPRNYVMDALPGEFVFELKGLGK